MRFCKSCDNMMYIKVDENKKLEYFCKNCNFVQKEESTGSVCILDSNHIDEETSYQRFISPNLKHDKALPRDNKIDCVNEKCTRRADQPKTVIFVKYDFNKMSYLYHCPYCEEFWTT